jgi:hypothetical protein
MERTLNYYGLPITAPEYFDGEHVANPMGAGMPPVCSCGWTRWEYAPGKWFELADHLRDMQDPADG